jgi:cytochrome c oxidase cbb3-type subunit 4
VSTYDTLRHFADSWGLLAMVLLFVGFSVWPFRPSARAGNEAARNLIFAEDSEEGEHHGQ